MAGRRTGQGHGRGPHRLRRGRVLVIDIDWYVQGSKANRKAAGWADLPRAHPHRERQAGGHAHRPGPGVHMRGGGRSAIAKLAPSEVALCVDGYASPAHRYRRRHHRPRRPPGASWPVTPPSMSASASTPTTGSRPAPGYCPTWPRTGWTSAPLIIAAGNDVTTDVLTGAWAEASDSGTRAHLPEALTLTGTPRGGCTAPASQPV